MGVITGNLPWPKVSRTRAVTGPVIQTVTSLQLPRSSLWTEKENVQDTSDASWREDHVWSGVPDFLDVVNCVALVRREVSQVTVEPKSSIFPV